MRLNYGQIYNKGHILRSDTHQREVLIRGRYLLLHLVKASMKVKVKHSLLVWHGTVSKFFVYFYFTSFTEVFFMFIYSYALALNKNHLPYILALRERCPYSEFFWVECGKIPTRKTPNTDTFYTVFNSSHKVSWNGW